MKHEVIVVGAGVIGCAVAHELARAGARPLLLERDAVAAHASGAAAGMLAPFTEGAGGGPLLAIGAEALDAYPQWVASVAELSGIDPQLRRCGVLRVARAGEVESLRAAAARLVPHGASWLEPDELRKRVPGVAEAAAGALWSPRESSVDAPGLTRALCAAALRRGASLREGVAVRGLLRDGERVTGVRTRDEDLYASAVVLCAGPWVRELDEHLGGAWPVEPVKGQMLALDAPVGGPASILWDPDVYLVPRPDGTLRVGATVERAGFDARPTADGVARLLGAARALLPDTGSCRFLRTWAGLRPATPDHLPLVGAVPGARDLWIAAGHHRNGILLAPWTAAAVAAGLLESRTLPGAAALAPERFAAGGDPR